MPNELVTRLLRWYDDHAQSYPWRGASAYAVWLSEVMLQQTRIETMLPYYTRFLAAYPTIHDLAAAPLEDVLKLWEGLGYYSRARYLHQTARIVSEQYGGQFPRTAAELLRLPGIGRYTAGAIASMVYGEAVPVLDGNVIRVLARLTDYSEDVRQSRSQKHLWELAESWVPQERPGAYNQALMELGQKVCTPRKPDCARCPLQALCRAYANGTQQQRPVKAKKAPTPHYNVAAGLIRDGQGRYLIAQRPAEGLLGGLWEFPGGKQEDGETLPECLQRELREELAIRVQVGELFVKVRHAFSHFKITLHAYECRYQGAVAPYHEPQCLEVADWAWVTQEELAQYSFGKADREVIRALEQRPQQLL